MKSCENVQAGEHRPVSVWDKVHAVGIFILGIAVVVMVGSSLIDRIAPVTPPAQQPVAPKTVNVLSPYGLPPVQTIDGKDSVTFIVHRPNETNDFRKTYHGEDVRWGFATTSSDLAVVDVTQPFKKLREEGVDVRYVFLQHTPLPVDDPAAV